MKTIRPYNENMKEKRKSIINKVDAVRKEKSCDSFQRCPVETLWNIVLLECGIH